MGKRRSGTGWLAALVLLVAAVGIGVYLARRQSTPEPYVLAPVPATQPEPVSAAPEPTHPIQDALPGAEIQDTGPLPELQDSDAAVLAELARLFGLEEPAGVFVAGHVIPRIVVTVDNLPRRRIVQRILPVRPAPGTLQVEEADGRLWLADANSGRYEAFVAMLESADPDAVAAAYVRAYPLFQSAYAELGYPDAYFNDRLVEVIEHLLAAPVPVRPLELEPAQRGYRYLDPGLESASVGHKLMFRLSAGQVDRVHAALREFRARVVAHERPESH
ncbi:MAG TPA: DUF3014 domain-containing protein [Xanthomonadaceae bacterium]|nr:DUF3014 domain-containing protein [Xanthomonadaceae bacterium]